VIVETAEQRARIENTLVARMQRLRRVLSVDIIAAAGKEP
jgi:hypothetical protein